jgi:dihydrofolate reductase
MEINLIVAIAKSNLGIGKNNQLLWHLPADMQFFKQNTVGYPIITGRKNYESIPEKFRPLTDRKNIILTHQKNYVAPRATIVNTINEALNEAKKEHKNKCFVIGGGEIYKLFLEQNLVEKLIITWVDALIDADTFFPELDFDKWNLIEEKHFLKDEKNKFDFTICSYEKKKN